VDRISCDKSCCELFPLFFVFGVTVTTLLRFATAQALFFWRCVLGSVRVGALVLLGLAVHSASNLDVLQQSFQQRWGAAALPKFEAWRKLLATIGDGSDLDRLKKVNAFFNQQIQFADDSVIWNQADYWATPLETLGRGAGDCEDFSIAKYFTLLQLGTQPEKLRLIYVRAKTGTSDATQAHMVLAYYATPEAEPLVLDNLISDIRPASRRPDLVPVFSFNSSGVFTGIAGGGTAAGGTGRLSRWEDLLRRAKTEGFD
jgi:predicted transglutaminase-like cysteine proteinase